MTVFRSYDNSIASGTPPPPQTFQVCEQLTGQPSKVHQSRGEDEYHASREPSTLTHELYARAGGASIQNWLLTFPEPYTRVTILEVVNASVRWETWAETELAPGTYNREGNTLWIGGYAGEVRVAYRIERCYPVPTPEAAATEVSTGPALIADILAQSAAGDHDPSVVQTREQEGYWRTVAEGHASEPNEPGTVRYFAEQATTYWVATIGMFDQGFPLPVIHERMGLWSAYTESQAGKAITEMQPIDLWYAETQQ